MFARFSAVLTLLLQLASPAGLSLPNGIRFGEFSVPSDRFEMVVGYESGVRNETQGASGLATIVSRVLASSPPARSLALAVYAAGGDVEFISELDRTAVRVSVPEFAKPMVLEQIAPLLAAMTPRDAGQIESARQAALQAARSREQEFRSKVEDEIRIALLASHAYHHPMEGRAEDLDGITADDVIRFFNENYGTDRAFVLMNSPLPADVRSKLEAIPARKSRPIARTSIRVSDAERIFKFPSEGTTGAVIFASPVAGVFYRDWYAALMFDRLVHRMVTMKTTTSLVPTVDPYYWRLEVPVPAGQFAENVQDELMQHMNRLQFTRARPEDLEVARREAREYLESAFTRQWFASHGIEVRRSEGLQWIQSFSADDMRATARDALLKNRVLAWWSARAQQATVQVESLLTASSSPATAPAVRSPLGPVPVTPFPAHTHSAKTWTTPERLASGVWIAASSTYAIFVSGAELKRYDREPDAATIATFQKYRPDRLLVLAPASSIDRVRGAWSAFRGNALDAAMITPLGNVANVDLPALIIEKAVLDRRLIESGWWRDASVRIDASRGAMLSIDAPAEIRSVIETWMKSLAAAPLSDADFAWAREVAIHHLNDVLPDLQSLLWQRVPEYILPDLETVSATHLQDVAKLYQ